MCDLGASDGIIGCCGACECLEYSCRSPDQHPKDAQNRFPLTNKPVFLVVHASKSAALWLPHCQMRAHQVLGIVGSLPG